MPASKTANCGIRRMLAEKLTALLHHVTIEVLRAAFFAVKRRAAAGIDAVTWDMYEENREENLYDLHQRRSQRPA